MVHAYTLYYYNRIHNVWVYFYSILKRKKYRRQKISSFWELSWVAGVEIVGKLFSLEMEQICIMIFVMVQKPIPVIKFHRAMHKKVHIKLMYQIIICILKSSINISFLVYIMYIIVIYKYICFIYNLMQLPRLLWAFIISSFKIQENQGISCLTALRGEMGQRRCLN